MEKVLENILAKINNNRAYYQKNESGVCNQIIVPILQTLDWDTLNPAEVQTQAHSTEGFPDCTLLENGKVITFIEVKKLDTKLEEKEIGQLAKYCFGDGKKYGIITNGTIWILLKSFEEDTKISDRIVWKINLEKDDLTYCKERLDSISKNNIKNLDRSELFNIKQNILNKSWSSLKENPNLIIKNVLSCMKEILNDNQQSKITISDQEIEDFIKQYISSTFPVSRITKDRKKINSSKRIKSSRKIWSRVVTLENDPFQIKYTYEILVITANWLIENNKLKLTNIPIKIGQKRYLINKIPKHVSDDKFMAGKQLSNNLWIETKFDLHSTIKYARYLLSLCGYNDNILVINEGSL